MRQLKIKSGQLEGVTFEIYGYANPETKEVGIQGLVREELPSETTKLHLKRFGKKVQDELKTLQESSKELWEKFGEKETNENGEETLRVPEDKIEEFRKAMTELLNTDIEFEIHDFKLEEFEFKSKTPEHSYGLLEVLFEN